MREANYGTIKGAKRYFLGLAEDFCMAEEVKVRLRNAESVSEIERIWKDALRSFQVLQERERNLLSSFCFFYAFLSIPIVQKGGIFMAKRYYDDPVSAYAAEYSNMMESPVTYIALVFALCVCTYLVCDGTKKLVQAYKDIKKNKEQEEP